MIKVVIVDDHPDACELLRNMIGDVAADFQVVRTFTNPVEFIKHKDQLDYDALFLDIEMPGLNGFDLHSQESRPVVFVSGTVPKHLQMLSEAISGSNATFLPKPLKVSNVMVALDSIRQKVSIGNTVKFKTSNGTAILNLNDIQLICSPKLQIADGCASSDPRDKILFAKGCDPLVLKATKFEECLSQLPESTFGQISSQVIISKNFIKTYRKQDLDMKVYDGETTAEVAFDIHKDYRKSFKKLIS